MKDGSILLIDGRIVPLEVRLTISALQRKIERLPINKEDIPPKKFVRSEFEERARAATSQLKN